MRKPLVFLVLVLGVAGIVAYYVYKQPKSPSTPTPTISIPVTEIPAPSEEMAYMEREPAPPPPVTIAGSLDPSGWTVSIVISDPTVTEIFYAIDDETQWKSTGFFDSRSPETGLPVPKPQIEGVAFGPGEHIVKIQYRDSKDREHGPYELPFDTLSQELEATKHQLDSMDWVTFLPNPDGTFLANVEPLLSHRKVLKEIRYSVNSDRLDQTLPFTPSPVLSPTTKETEKSPLFELPAETRFMVVQLRYIDGTESESRHFENN